MGIYGWHHVVPAPHCLTQTAGSYYVTCNAAYSLVPAGAVSVSLTWLTALWLAIIQGCFLTHPVMCIASQRMHGRHSLLLMGSGVGLVLVLSRPCLPSIGQQAIRRGESAICNAEMALCLVGCQHTDRRSLYDTPAPLGNLCFCPRASLCVKTGHG